MNVLARLPLFFHLLGFAAFLGAAFAQQELLKASAKGIATQIRDSYETLAAGIITKLEVPATFVQLLSGISFVIQAPEFLKQGWLHAKLAAVVVLLVLSHFEMFNARAIVRLRATGGTVAAAEIESRKKRHALMGLVGTACVVVVLVMVVFVR